MPRALSEIARELNENLEASRYTTALLPANVKASLALAVELAEGAADLAARVENLEAIEAARPAA